MNSVNDFESSGFARNSESASNTLFFFCFKQKNCYKKTIFRVRKKELASLSDHHRLNKNLSKKKDLEANFFFITIISTSLVSTSIF